MDKWLSGKKNNQRRNKISARIVVGKKSSIRQNAFGDVPAADNIVKFVTEIGVKSIGPINPKQQTKE